MRVSLSRQTNLAAVVLLATAGCSGTFVAEFENRSDQEVVATWVVIYDERNVESTESVPPGASYELRIPEIAEWYEFHVRLASGVEHEHSVYFDSLFDASPRLVIYSDRLELEARDASRGTLPNKALQLTSHSAFQSTSGSVWH